MLWYRSAQDLSFRSRRTAAENRQFSERCDVLLNALIARASSIRCRRNIPAKCVCGNLAGSGGQLVVRDPERVRVMTGSSSREG